MSAKNLKTGINRNASHLPAKWWVHAPKTYSQRMYMKRLTPEQLHARLIVFIGCTLAVVFALCVLGMLYALIFVTQPISNQAPNDRAFIDLLTTLCIFLTGSLGGVLASNGLKSKAKPEPEETKP
jgi:Na+/proline symporter